MVNWWRRVAGGTDANGTTGQTCGEDGRPTTSATFAGLFSWLRHNAKGNWAAARDLQLKTTAGRRLQLTDLLGRTMTNCTRCEGTGFLNLHQIPDAILVAMDSDYRELVPKWITEQTEPHDVQVCDCCGNGETWYGEPGQHYGADDPPGPNGPYASNGGLCCCH